MVIWNPWHGCHKVSEGCEHCYMYFLDGKRGVDTSIVTRTANFDLPLRRDRHGSFKLKSGMQYRISSKEVQSKQAFLSGLSHYNEKPIFNLTPGTPSIFGEVDTYKPYFRSQCATCGSRMTCNGCSNCGNCKIR